MIAPPVRRYDVESNRHDTAALHCQVNMMVDRYLRTADFSKYDESIQKDQGELVENWTLYRNEVDLEEPMVFDCEITGNPSGVIGQTHEPNDKLVLPADSEMAMEALDSVWMGMIWIKPEPDIVICCFMRGDTERVGRVQGNFQIIAEDLDSKNFAWPLAMPYETRPDKPIKLALLAKMRSTCYNAIPWFNADGTYNSKSILKLCGFMRVDRTRALWKRNSYLSDGRYPEFIKKGPTDNVAAMGRTERALIEERQRLVDEIRRLEYYYYFNSKNNSLKGIETADKE